MIREPGDLPSNRVDAPNIGRGVPVDDAKDAVVFWSSLAPTAGHARTLVFSFLKAAVDDASADQRPKIGAIYVVLFAANALVWIWAAIALTGRPTLLGTAFL